MSASIDTDGHDKPSLDVAINIVPFIDAISCVAVFLLATTAWQRVTQIGAPPSAERFRDADWKDPPDVPLLAVLVEDDVIYVGATRLPNGSGRTIDRRSPDAWNDLGRALADVRRDYFEDRRDIRIAAQSRPDHVVAYQDLVAAMEVAIQAGFTDVDVVDPSQLAWRPER